MVHATVKRIMMMGMGYKKRLLYLNFWIIHHFHFIADERPWKTRFWWFFQSSQFPFLIPFVPRFGRLFFCFHHETNEWKMIRWQAQKRCLNAWMRCLMVAGVYLMWFTLLTRLCFWIACDDAIIKHERKQSQASVDTTYCNIITFRVFVHVRDFVTFA